jgi:hypothetical protein
VASRNRKALQIEPGTASRVRHGLLAGFQQFGPSLGQRQALDLLPQLCRRCFQQWAVQQA